MLLIDTYGTYEVMILEPIQKSGDDGTNRYQHAIIHVTAKR